jgi:hypothetical protein
MRKTGSDIIAHLGCPLVVLRGLTTDLNPVGMGRLIAVLDVVFRITQKWRRTSRIQYLFNNTARE